MKLVVLDRRHKGWKPRRRMAPSFQHLAPGSLWLDNSGNRIRAHGAGLLSHDGLYYWYGAHGYRRPDLFEGPPNRRINVYYSNSLERWNASELPAFEIDHGYVDRPKVVHSREKDLFVMWMKATPYIAVATSTSPLGPFTLRGRWRPFDLAVGDLTTFVPNPFKPGGFIVFSVKPTAPGTTRVLRIHKLTSDLMNITDDPAPHAIIPLPREAPAVFYGELTGKYYLWTSHVSGWRPNAPEVFTAPSMGGPWTSIGNPTFSATGYNSQVSYILPLGIEHGHERFLCAADRFDPYINTSESGRYVWNPLEVFRERSREGDRHHDRLVMNDRCDHFYCDYYWAKAEVD